MTTMPGHLVVEGLGSIRYVELDLSTNVTVLIEANRSSKSNLVSALELMSRIWDDPSRGYLRRCGGVDNLLFEDEQTRTDRILITLMSGSDEWDTRNGYRVALRPGEVTGSGLAELHERLLFQAGHERYRPYERNLDLGSQGRARDATESENSGKLSDSVRYVCPILEGHRVSHFDDVFSHVPVKGRSTVGDDLALRSDAKNIVACPYRVSREYLGHCERIVAAIRHATPLFDDFVLRPDPSERIRLRWKQRDLDRIFLAREASGDTLRFICLVTLLLGSDLPAMVVLDGPDLGFHPAAIDLLAEMARVAGRNGHGALLVTRLVPLVSHFDLDEIVIPDRVDGAMEILRPDEAFPTAFLENYSTGNLWEMNLLEGHPVKVGLGAILNRCPTFAAWQQDLLSWF